MSLATGDRLGPYEILGLVGAGGMGDVYRACDPRLGRDVAIKVITADAAPSAERLRRFEDEARAVASLSHPNVLAVFDVGTRGAEPYVVFELLEGESLRQRLRGGPLPLRSAVETGVQVCRGLQAAHGRGILHRDLKPENLFLTSDGFVKILDFGLAKLTRGEGAEAGAERTQTAAGVVMGTPGYLSPEQARGQEADARSDIFALGAILYEALSGKRAFCGRDGGGHDLGDPERRPATDANGLGPAAEAGGPHRAALSREAAGESVRLRARPGPRAGGGAGEADSGLGGGDGRREPLPWPRLVHGVGRGAFLRPRGRGRGALATHPGPAAPGCDRAVGGGQDVFRAGGGGGVPAGRLGGGRHDAGELTAADAGPGAGPRAAGRRRGAAAARAVRGSGRRLRGRVALEEGPRASPPRRGPVRGALHPLPGGGAGALRGVAGSPRRRGVGSTCSSRCGTTSSCAATSTRRWRRSSPS